MANWIAAWIASTAQLFAGLGAGGRGRSSLERERARLRAEWDAVAERRQARRAAWLASREEYRAAFGMLPEPITLNAVRLDGESSYSVQLGGGAAPWERESDYWASLAWGERLESELGGEGGGA